MTDLETAVARLTAALVALDSCSSVSNIPVAERIEAELDGFEVERLDYTDPKGVPKRALVAHRGPRGGYALSGHMDTVPPTGWITPAVISSSHGPRLYDAPTSSDAAGFHRAAPTQDGCSKRSRESPQASGLLDGALFTAASLRSTGPSRPKAIAPH